MLVWWRSACPFTNWFFASVVEPWSSGLGIEARFSRNRASRMGRMRPICADWFVGICSISPIRGPFTLVRTQSTRLSDTTPEMDCKIYSRYHPFCFGS